MAKCASSADAPRASCGNLTDLSRPRASRRQFVGGGALAIAAVAAPIAVAAAPAHRFDQLLAEYRAADAAIDRFSQREYNPAVERALRSAGPTPSLQFEVPTREQGNRSFLLRPSDAEALAAKDGPLWGQEVWAAPVARRYVEWVARSEAAEAAEGIPALERRENELHAACDAARERLMREPAPDGAALAEKLLIASSVDVAVVDRRFVADLRADAERLRAAV